jgi:hypothetical protein
LERVQHRCRPDFDKHMPQTLFLQIERDARVKDSLVEVDQPVHVGGEEGQMVNAVDKSYSALLS